MGISRFLGQNCAEINSDENEIFLYFYQYLFKHSSDENKESDHQGQDILIFRQILLTSSIKNAWRTVRRMCIFISGLTRLNLSTFCRTRNTQRTSKGSRQMNFSK